MELGVGLERLEPDPRRTQVSIFLCVASSLCCKKRRTRRRRWHRLLLFLCAMELLQCSSVAPRCGAAAALQQAPSSEKPESSRACYNASFRAYCSELAAASCELWRAPELALQQAPELVAASSELRSSASSELRKAPELVAVLQQAPELRSFSGACLLGFSLLAKKKAFFFFFLQ